MFKRILAATDFNELSTAAIRLAVGIAVRGGGELTVVYADRFEPPVEFTAAQFAAMVESIDASRTAAKKELDEYLAKLIGGLSARYRSVVAEGGAAESILKLAESEKSELIVMGTHGRGGIQRMIVGSVAERVIAGATVPVLTVRSSSIPAVIQQVGILSESEHESFHALSSSLGAETKPVTGFDDPRVYDIIALPASEARRPLIRHIQTPVLFMPPSRVPAR